MTQGEGTTLESRKIIAATKWFPLHRAILKIEAPKNKINLDDRTDFAERLEEIESKVDTETYDPLENERELQEMIINNDNI